MSIAPHHDDHANVPEGLVLTRADILSSADVAELLSVPKSTVEEWARQGKIPSHKRGKRRFYLRWQIAAWLVADDG